MDNRGKGIPLRDGRSAALAAVHRNAQNLLIVDDGLYIAGGMPLLVRGDGIVGAGADRTVAGPDGALRIRAANCHRRNTDFALCGGRFDLPGSLEYIAATRWPRSGIRIETLDGEAVDPVLVRLDAAFRTAWDAMNRWNPKTRPDGFPALHAVFADACGPGEDDRLTVARAAALRGLLALVQNRNLRRAARAWLRDVRGALDAAEASGPVPPPAAPLDSEQEAALASLFV